MQVCIKTKQQKTANNKKTCRNTCAKLACGPSNFKNTNPTCKQKNMFSATEDFDPPMEIEY